MKGVKYNKSNSDIITNEKFRVPWSNAYFWEYIRGYYRIAKQESGVQALHLSVFDLAKASCNLLSDQIVQSGIHATIMP